MRLLAVVAALLLVVSTGAGWYFSGQIRAAALQVEPLTTSDNVRVVSVTPTTVSLEPTGATPDDLATDKVYGLDWGTGAGQLLTLQNLDGDRVTRALQLLQGSLPVEGQSARFTRDAYPRIPGSALDFRVRSVTYGSDGTRFAAYLAAGRGHTWAVLVHGRGAARAETFRLMRVSRSLGFPSLAITYRRDPENGGGLARYGQDEWRDLHMAVQYALRHGANRVVVMGVSMGGGIAAAFLERSPLAARVSALVLDAPMLDFQAVVRFGARSRSLPVLGTPLPGAWVSGATRLAGARFGLDMDAVDYLDETSWLRVPTLSFHGTADHKVPASLTSRLKQAHPGLVSAVLVPGADHVESWNVGPAAYERRVRDFLRPLAPTSR